MLALRGRVLADERVQLRELLLISIGWSSGFLAAILRGKAGCLLEGLVLLPEPSKLLPSGLIGLSPRVTPAAADLAAARAASTRH